MDKPNEKHFGLRVDGDILAKFRYVCGFEGGACPSTRPSALCERFLGDEEEGEEKNIL